MSKKYKKCPECNCKTLEVRRTAVCAVDYINGKSTKCVSYRLSQKDYFCTKCDWSDEI